MTIFSIRPASIRSPNIRSRLRASNPVSLWVTCLVVSCAGTPPLEPIPCEWSAESSIGLTRRDARDILSVSVFGPSCADATLTLRIRTRDHRPIYRFETPLAVFLSVSGDPSAVSETQAPAQVRSVVEELVRAQALRTVSDLPSWSAGETDDGITYHQHLLPRPELLRLSDQPVFQHRAGWQLEFELAYDPRADQVVRVLESWR